MTQWSSLLETVKSVSKWETIGGGGRMFGGFIFKRKGCVDASEMLVLISVPLLPWQQGLIPTALYLTSYTGRN